LPISGDGKLMNVALGIEPKYEQHDQPEKGGKRQK
jgi:hypothetical protein